jgi:hypothetical protein
MFILVIWDHDVFVVSFLLFVSSFLAYSIEFISFSTLVNLFSKSIIRT